MLEVTVGKIVSNSYAPISQYTYCGQVTPRWSVAAHLALSPAAIGEIERFESPKKLAGYSGLASGVEQSGTKLREKGITKEGRKELRWATPHLRWVQVWWRWLNEP
jgi:transposase